MRNLSIRTKLIVLIIAATSVLLAGILAVISGNLQRQMARKVLSDFDKTQHYFKRQEALIYDRLVESCLLIGQNAAFKANVALNDGPSVQQAVEEFAQFTKTDLLVVTDHTGRVLGWLDNAAAFGEALGQRPGMERALAGQEPDWLLEEVLLWEIDGQLFQIVAAPIFAGVTLLGAIVMGTRFTDFEARYLKGASAIDICMFLDTILVGASIPDSDLPDKQEHLRRFRADYQSLIDATLTSGQTSEAFSARFAGEDVFAYVSPLGMGAPGYYLAFARKSTEMAFLRQLFQHIFFIGLGGFALAAIMALVLGNRFSRPVITLARAMDQVKQGSLDIALPVRSRDEFGQLTLAFNRMMEVLRERLRLMKYVSDHTIDMIRSQDDRHSPADSRRLEAALVFTDIRGFTAYAEMRQPEEVIDMLNAWLGFQAEIVRAYQGMVDKYSGDEMFAFFTGEEALPRAYRCAQDIQAEAIKKNVGAIAPIRIGIGLHHGLVVMGNIGNETRMDYTVIGAAVNLSARLCNAAGGGEILLTEAIAARLRLDTGDCARETMRFKGIAQPVEVFRVKGWKPAGV